MSVVASFGAHEFRSSDVLMISGTIDYPWVRFANIKGFTTLQIASKHRETVQLVVRVDFLDLSLVRNIASLRSRRDLYLWDQLLGEFIIDSLRWVSSQDNTVELSIGFLQTEAMTYTGSYPFLSDRVGGYGTFHVISSNVLAQLRFQQGYPLNAIDRLNNFVQIQDSTNTLRELDISMRFNTLYDASPQGRFNSLRALADNLVAYPLEFLGVNYGNYVVSRLRWDRPREETINVVMSLLETPSTFKPRKPKITSFVVNSVQRVDSLAPVLLSVKYQDAMTTDTSILELEFDATASGLPQEGDSIEIKWGYENSSSSQWFNSGTHKCDYPEQRYDPNILRMGAQSYDYQLSLNSSQQVNYFEQPLSSIVSSIANTFNLRVIGSISPVIAGAASDPGSPVKVSGAGYADILRQLAEDYGYRLKLRLGNLYFESFSSLESQGAIATFSPGNTVRAEFIRRISGLYRMARVYYDTGFPATAVDNDVPNNNTLDLKEEGYYKNVSSALLRSNGAIKLLNRLRHSGSLQVEGQYFLEPGKNINLSGFGDSDNGKFQIERVIHDVSPQSGWSTTLEVRKVFS